MASTESVSHDDLIVCACGDREYKARDAIDAAFFRGDLGPTWKAFVHRAESQKHAEERDMDLDEDAFDAAAEAFRYQHDLITAEETEQWLAARSLTLEDFGDYFARQCWATAVTEKVDRSGNRLSLCAGGVARSVRVRTPSLGRAGAYDDAAEPEACSLESGERVRSRFHRDGEEEFFRA